MFDFRPKKLVTIIQTGETYMCAIGENLLKGMTLLGRKGIPVGCVNGGCGVCKVQVLQGQYQARPISRSHVSEDDQASHQVLACCIVPQTDLQLRVIGRMRKAWQAPA